jgi:hypothetical protein
MLMLANTTEVLGKCVHCLATVTVAKIPSFESFLTFERTGRCPECQKLQ